MPANSILAANRINASVAGQTQPKSHEPMPTEAAINNVASAVTGGFDTVMAGGIHPELDPTPTIDRSLQRATDSVKGVLGGLRPKGTSTSSPGPSGSINAAAAVQSGTKKITDAGAASANSVRKYIDRLKPKA